MSIKFIFEDMCEALEGALNELSSSLAEKDHSLKAKFANPSTLLSRYHEGISITGDKYLTDKQSMENAFIISPSGGGKTTTNIIPTCLRIAAGGNSIIINDPSSEIQSLTENYYRSKGYKVYVLNFGDPHCTVYFNPLARCIDTATTQKMVRMLVQTANSKDKDFWTSKSIQIIGLLINYLRECESKIYFNITIVNQLLQLLQGELETAKQLFAEKMTEEQWSQLRSILGNSENTRASIISSAQASTAFVAEDLNLANRTCLDTLDFESFRKQKSVLYLQCPQGDVAYYKSLLSIFWSQYFDFALKTIPEKDDLSIYCCIDELASIHLPNLSNILSVCRKFRTPVLGVLQSEQQLVANYGEHNANAILNNAGVRVYFTGLKYESKHLSDALGEYEYKDKDGTLRRRKLMAPDECRTMKRDTVIILPSNGLRPIKTKIRPYYKQPRLLKMVNTKLDPEISDHVNEPLYRVQYLDVSKYRQMAQQSQSKSA